MVTTFRIRRAAQILRNGGVIAYPTEGVYGIGCLPSDEQAIAHILQTKQRSAEAGLILIAAHLDQLEGWILPAPEELRHLQAPVARPTTWVVTAGPLAGDLLTGGRDTLAVRITEHPVAATLCLAAQSPLVSTSANRRGSAPALTARAARQKLGFALDYVISGPLSHSAGASEIRVAIDDQLIRPAA